ncbi:hypothetical protein OBBRIDRAFT_842965, partial [Obba rivulosa]
SAALRAITDYIERNKEELSNVDSIKEWIAFELGDDEQNRPFLWKAWNSGQRKTGRLQSELILRTLATHLHALAAIPSNIELSSKPPVGALIYSVLAVERALSFWKEGFKKVPAGAAGHFSEDYWGDRVGYISGRNVNNQRASKFLKVTATFTDKTWDEIWNGAYLFYKEKRRQPYRQAAADIPLEDAEQDSFVMESDESSGDDEA